MPAETFVKKPVEIQAIRWTGSNTSEVIDWIRSAASCGVIPVKSDGEQGHVPGYIAVETLEGTMRAAVGDWIIRGIKGEMYPCKPDIFYATYERVVPDTAS